MLIDEHGLFYAPHPDHGSWGGHVQKYLEVQSNLRVEIAFADGKGCPVSNEARMWSTEPPPTAPF